MHTTREKLIAVAVVYGAVVVAGCLVPAVSDVAWVVLVGAWLGLASVVARPVTRLARPYWPVLLGRLARVSVALRPSWAGVYGLAARHAAGWGTGPLPRPAAAGRRGPVTAPRVTKVGV